MDAVVAVTFAAVAPVIAGGVLSLLTVTEISAAVPAFAAASRARADRRCVPFAAVVVSHATAYGAAVSSRPSGAPSSRNRTPATPMLSAAVAVTDTVPET